MRRFVSKKMIWLLIMIIKCKLLEAQNTTLIVKHIKTVYRFEGVQKYDHYFTCSACGSSLQWKANNLDAASHFITDPIGEVRYRINNDEINYLSVLLAKLQINSNQCLIAMLLVSDTSTQTWNVSCRGDSEQMFVLSSNATSNAETAAMNDVKMTFAFRTRNILIAINSGYETYVFVCKVNSTSQTWLINGRSSGGFVKQSNLGTEAIQRYTNENVIRSEAVLLANNNLEQTLTSLLVLSEESNYTDNLQVRCRSDAMEVNIDVVPADDQKNASATNSIMAETVIPKFTASTASFSTDFFSHSSFIATTTLESSTKSSDISLYIGLGLPGTTIIIVLIVCIFILIPLYVFHVYHRGKLYNKRKGEVYKLLHSDENLNSNPIEDEDMLDEEPDKEDKEKNLEIMSISTKFEN